MVLFATPGTARGAGNSAETTVAPPRAATEHTLVDLGIVALKVETGSIVLGAADSPAMSPAPSFAGARSSGAFALTGNAKATLSLTLDLGDALADASGRIPLPLGGGWAHNARAAISLGAGGKLSLDLGSSFGFSGASGGGAAPGGHLTFNTNILNPRKRTTLGWRYAF